MSRQIYKTPGGGNQGFSSWSTVEFSSIRKNYIVHSGAASGRDLMGSGVEHKSLAIESSTAWVAAGPSLSVWDLVALVDFPEVMALAQGMAFVVAEEWEVVLKELWIGWFFNRPRVFGPGAIQEVNINQSLLHPLSVETDPQTVKMEVKKCE